MCKKWIHIFLTVWLINAVTYFHASTNAELFIPTHDASTDGDACLKINSWTDCLLQSLFDDDGDFPQEAHKIKFQRRYVRGRNFNGNIFLPTPNFFYYYKQFKNAVTCKVNHYCIGVALLPAYYSFLFRLSPF